MVSFETWLTSFTKG